MNHDHENHGSGRDAAHEKMNHSSHSCCGGPAPGEGGFHKHAGHSVAQFRQKFWVSLALTVPVLALSPLVQQFLGFSLKFPGDRMVLFLISTIVFLYGGYPFLKGAYDEIRFRAIGMMTLISIAIAVAYFYSTAVVFGLEGKLFFWELVTLIDIMLLGHWMEMKSVMGASSALEKLTQLIPDKAHLVKGEEIVDVATSEIEQGDTILVKPGEKIPVDGTILEGESFVNESLVTGESKPVSKGKGGKVIGGSLNGDGSLTVKAEGVGEKSYLSKVINLVRGAQASKSKTQNIADRAAFWLTVIALSVGAITFVSWFLARGDLAFAIERTATVLVITCPHALGLAIPLVVAISSILSAQNGLLIRNRTAFENSRNVSTVIFDKTGTLTEGTFSVKKIYSLDDNYGENDILKLSASLERNSEHPIAKAVLEEAKKRNIETVKINGFRALKGKGVEAEVEEKKTMVVSPGYAKELGFDIPEDLKNVEGTLILTVVSENGKDILAGAINLADTVREESHEAVKSLKKQNIKIWMLTGDNENSARAVSEELGINGYFAGVLPDEKQEKVKELQRKGELVAMVGDGINDAPALAQADVGIAIGSGTDIAAETADIILVNSNPRDIASLILFGRATYRKMIQNLVWATGYNVFAIPLAAGVLAGYGILLSPAVGAVFMSLSTVIVAVNAKTLKVRNK